MKTEAGLWIDHRQVVIVTLVDQIQEPKRITSDIEEQVRYSGDSQVSHDDATEIRRDRQDRRFDDQIGQYYDEDIAWLRDADSILIFGPGEMKGELQNHLKGQALSELFVNTEATDSMDGWSDCNKSPTALSRLEVLITVGTEPSNSGRQIKKCEEYMDSTTKFSTEEARSIGTQLGINWTQIDLEQFRRGLEVELEHGAIDPDTDVTGDDPVLTGKIAWAHLKEIADYYTRLDQMEAEAEGKD